jgi:general secretion pathway protein F
MATFYYKGLHSTGREIKDSISADSELQAKQKLKGMGIMIISIAEKKSGAQSSKKSFTLFTSKKVPVNELGLMTRQFATLIKARIQIVEALNALVNQVDHEHLKFVLADVKTRVNEGTSLAKSLANHKDVFDNIYINMVEAGEASGTLDKVMVRLAEFKEAQMKMKSKLSGALTYPIMMASFGSLAIGFIFIKVVPQFANMLIKQKKKLPAITEAVMSISTFLQNYWWLAILIIFGVVFLIKQYVRSPSGERNWHRLQLNLPIFGPIVKMVNVARFCSTMSTLLASGVPILPSMSIVKNLVTNVLLKDAIEKSRTAVSEGSSMTGPLMDSGYFPSMVTHMLKLGENSGELEQMLNIIADNYQTEVEDKLSGLTSLLEPVMILMMAVVVGVIALSVIMPMMEMMSRK